MVQVSVARLCDQLWRYGMGRNRVNPHYHILLDVPDTQKQTYEALNQVIKDPKVTLRFEKLHLAKPSELKRLANYLLKENHWQNGHIYAFCANHREKQIIVKNCRCRQIEA